VVALSKVKSRVAQRQIDLNTAVCQERLLATHVRHVLAFVDLVSEQIPFDDALDIYVRILQLSPEQARNVGSRALAELARRPGGLPMESELAEDFGQPEPEEVEEERASESREDALFARVRRRIKGRHQGDLRERINLAAARAEDDLVQTHVENAMIFARALAKEVPASEASELYLEILAIPEGVADVIYNRSLRRLADDLLPPLPDMRNGTATGADLERS
jgi:hypothetical protein